MKFLSIDPGDQKSGYVFYDSDSLRPIDGGFGKIPNAEIFGLIDREILSANKEERIPVVVCEFPQPRGQLMSWQLIDTVEMIGRFKQHGIAFGSPFFQFHKIDRAHVKSHVCAGVQRPKDSNVRQALVDKFGGESATSGPKCPECKGSGGFGRGASREVCSRCNGSKEVTPGALYGVTGDVWQALAVAVMFSEIGRVINRS